MDLAAETPVITDQNTKLQRLEEVKNDPQTMNVVAQRVADGETLKDIAHVWQIPFGAFQLWIMSDRERMQLYDSALSAIADQLVMETVEIADDVYEKDEWGHVMYDSTRQPIRRDTSRDRLSVKTRFTAAQFLDRKRFGNTPEKNIQPISQGNAGIGEVVKILSFAFAEMDKKATYENNEISDAEEVTI